MWAKLAVVGNNGIFIWLMVFHWWKLLDEDDKFGTMNEYKMTLRDVRWLLRELCKPTSRRVTCTFASRRPWEFQYAEEIESTPFSSTVEGFVILITEPKPFFQADEDQFLCLITTSGDDQDDDLQEFRSINIGTGSAAADNPVDYPRVDPRATLTSTSATSTSLK